MARRPRRNHTPTFKARVAIAAIKGDRTLAELAEQFDAEAASTDVEDLIHAVQHFEPGKGRLFFYVAGLEAEPAGPPN